MRSAWNCWKRRKRIEICKRKMTKIKCKSSTKRKTFATKKNNGRRMVGKKKKNKKQKRK